MTRCRPTDTAIVIADEHAENIAVLAHEWQRIGKAAVCLRGLVTPQESDEAAYG